MAALPQDCPDLDHGVSELAQSVAGFTLNMYNQLAKQNTDRNLCFSPFSICSSLGLILAGSRGNTAKQISGALKLKPGEESLHSVFKRVFHSLNSTHSKHQLSVSNSIFVDKTFIMRNDYLKITMPSYKPGLTRLNFREDPEGARYTINDWVENKTEGKIRDIIPSGMLSADVVLVLINAIHFKAMWKDRFKGYSTKVRPFALSNGGEVSVDMMIETGTYLLGDLVELDCQVLELPYVEKKFSMFILLPNQIDGLTDLETRLTADILMSAHKVVSSKTVEVNLPKFKIDYSSEISNILQKLGIKDMFLSSVADLTGIAGNKRGELFVSKAVHKTFIEVNEMGTEAAAATRDNITWLCRVHANFHFKADHPFLFFIQHKITGSILFVGRLVKPKASG